MSSNALDSLRDGTRKRQHRIHTPAPIWDGLRNHWALYGGVQLDPCWSPDALERPPMVCYPEHEHEMMRDGLAIDWVPRTYCNPPFGKLKPWILKFTASWEVILLAPVRPHRRWYRHAMARHSAIVWLDPLCFDGYDHTFPAPLALMYRGERPMSFLRCFGELGEGLAGPSCHVARRGRL